MTDQDEYVEYLSAALGGLRQAYKATEKLWLWRGSMPMSRKIRRLHRKMEKAHKQLLDLVRNEPGRPG